MRVVMGVGQHSGLRGLGVMGSIFDTAYDSVASFVTGLINNPLDPRVLQVIVDPAGAVMGVYSANGQPVTPPQGSGVVVGQKLQPTPNTPLLDRWTLDVTGLKNIDSDLSPDNFGHTLDQASTDIANAYGNKMYGVPDPNSIVVVPKTAPPIITVDPTTGIAEVDPNASAASQAVEAAKATAQTQGNIQSAINNGSYTPGGSLTPLLIVGGVLAVLAFSGGGAGAGAGASGSLMPVIISSATSPAKRRRKTNGKGKR